MTNTGFVLAGAGANNADAGNVAWSTPGNVTADDAAYATASVPGGQTSQYLHATTFGFAIPSATIDGIQVRVQRNEASLGDNAKDHTIQLIKGGTRSGTNNADTATNWPTTDTNKDYGGTADLWGNTLSAADVNASNFGVAVRITSIEVTKGNAEPKVDAIWIAVEYTLLPASAYVGERFTQSRFLAAKGLVR